MTETSILLTISIPSHGRTEVHTHSQRVFSLKQLTEVLMQYSTDEHKQDNKWIITSIVANEIALTRYDTLPRYMRDKQQPDFAETAAFQAIYETLLDADRLDLWQALCNVINAAGEQSGMVGREDYELVQEWLDAEVDDYDTFLRQEQSAG